MHVCTCTVCVPYTRCVYMYVYVSMYMHDFTCRYIIILCMYMYVHMGTLVCVAHPGQYQQVCPPMMSLSPPHPPSPPPPPPPPPSPPPPPPPPIPLSRSLSLQPVSATPLSSAASLYHCTCSAKQHRMHTHT